MNTRVYASNNPAPLFGQRNNAVYLFLKRAIDICVATCALILLSPLLILASVLIPLESPGSPLFSQDRVGKNGRLFRCWKFRSMFKDAEARKSALMANNEMEGGVTFKMQRDPRITGIGRFIRKASIDELPQLWNVLVGDMTLVGPRPAVPSEVEQYTPLQRRRLEVTPGITCIWQVSGRSNLPFVRQVELDIQYIQRQSLWLDLVLLVQTVPAVLTSRGAV